MTKPAITRPARQFLLYRENTKAPQLLCMASKPTIPYMQVREAKDFLVQQTAEQAQLEGIPFSGLERRMMYFTEIEEMPEDPIKLNEEFEAEYDSGEYEAKISKLLHHAHARIKKENPEAARQWSDAIRELGKGDHYILVLWNESSLTGSTLTERPPHDFLKLFAVGLGVAALVVIAAFIPVKFEPQWRRLQEIFQAHSHVLFGIFITIVLAGFFFPRRIGIAVGWLMERTLFRFLGPKEDEKDTD